MVTPLSRANITLFITLLKNFPGGSPTEAVGTRGLRGEPAKADPPRIALLLSDRQRDALDDGGITRAHADEGDALAHLQVLDLLAVFRHAAH